MPGNFDDLISNESPGASPGTSPGASPGGSSKKVAPIIHTPSGSPSGPSQPSCQKAVSIGLSPGDDGKKRVSLLLPHDHKDSRRSNKSEQSSSRSHGASKIGNFLMAKVSSSMQNIKSQMSKNRIDPSRTQARLQQLQQFGKSGAFLSVVRNQVDHATVFNVRAESENDEETSGLVDQVFVKVVHKDSPEEPCWRIPAMSEKATLFRKLLKLLAVFCAGLALFDLAFADTCYQNSSEQTVIQAMRAVQIIFGVGYTMLAVTSCLCVTVVSPYHGIEYVDTRDIAIWHLFSFKFWLDFTAAFSLIPEVIHFHQAQRWGTLLTLARLWRCFERSSFQSERNHALQVIKLVLYLCFLAHTWACAWTVLTIQDARRGERSWATDLLKQNCGCRDLYAASLYFMTCTITGVGYGDIVVGSPVEQFETVILMLAGAMVMAKVFADLTWITSTHNHWTAEHFSKITQMFIALENLGVGEQLRRRVLAYQEYTKLCARERAVQRFLDQLSIPLQTELKLAIYHELVVGASLFAEASLEVIRLVICHLTDRVYMPFDFVFREGCLGDELFFMRRGSVAILSGPGAYAVPVSTTQPGDHFGEVAVILGTFRRSWAMARTYVITSVLSKDVIDDLQVNYPEAFVQLVKEVKHTAGVTPKVSLTQLADLLAEKFIDTADAFASIIADQPAATLEATATDFIKAMLNLGLSRFDALLLWSELDEDSSGSIDYEEFCSMCEKNQQGSAQRLTISRSANPKDLKGYNRKKSGNDNFGSAGSTESTRSVEMFPTQSIFLGEIYGEDQEEYEDDTPNSHGRTKDSNFAEEDGLEVNLPADTDADKDVRISSKESTPKCHRILPKVPASQLTDALQSWRATKIHRKQNEVNERPLCRETVREETEKAAEALVQHFDKDIGKLRNQFAGLHRTMDGILARSGVKMGPSENDVKQLGGLKGMPIFLACS